MIDVIWIGIIAGATAAIASCLNKNDEDKKIKEKVCEETRVRANEINNTDDDDWRECI